MESAPTANGPLDARRGRLGRKAYLMAGLLALLAALPLPAAAGEGTVPPRLEARMLDGSRFSLDGSRGSITVVVVWSPDSLASKKSLGELERFAAGFRDRGVAVVAASTSGDEEAIRRFTAARQLDLPVGILEGTDLGPLPERAMPLVYVFGRDGRLHSTHRGLFRLRDLEQLVAPLL